MEGRRNKDINDVVVSVVWCVCTCVWIHTQSEKGSTYRRVRPDTSVDLVALQIPQRLIAHPRLDVLLRFVDLVHDRLLCSLQGLTCIPQLAQQFLVVPLCIRLGLQANLSGRGWTVSQ